MLITRNSIISGIERTLEIPVLPEELIAWESGEKLIQDAMPNLTVSEREFIMTGIIDSEWEEAFKDE